MPRLMEHLEDFIQLNFHPRRAVKVTVRFFLYLAPQHATFALLKTKQ